MTHSASTVQRPSDWPATGPIDLARHDLPHASSTTEWWYLNTHFRSAEGRAFSLFAAFFRIVSKRLPDGRNEYAHSLTWALVDETEKEYLATSLVDEKSPQLGLDKLRNGQGSTDERLNRAMREQLEAGFIPRPDRVFDGPVQVPLDRLALDYAGNTFTKEADGRYRLHLRNADTPRGRIEANLTFTLQKPPTRHGDEGVVRGVHGEDMFYYFVPRCGVEGEVSIGTTRLPVTGAQGWYDHEFGCPPPGRQEAKARTDQGFVGWNWVSAQLDDGTDISLYDLVSETTKQSVGHWAIFIDSQGQRRAYDTFSVREASDANWRSTRTFETYPTAFHVQVPEADLTLEVRAAFEDQELVTVISKPAFWEGRCHVTGTFRGKAVTGLGFVERSGFTAEDEGLDGFFKRVGETVRASVRAVYPDQLSQKHAETLVAAPGREAILDGVDFAQLQRTLLAPVRTITDRGGKSWRSYAALACCDVVLGDSRKFTEWLAFPEFMHVGSLIVDDVQDKSTVRRGGPASHLVFGEALALNAGTAAYFMGERLLKRSLVSDERKLRLYDLYFEALREGHAGQAIDLDGLDRYVPEILASGDGAALERRVLAIHRLKTAAPAAALARMGAVAGGGSDVQVEALGRYFEALGLAFQIVDDVLNLRGFEGDLKQKGEDLSQGKVTLPVARALGRLSAPERQALWSAIAAKPNDAAVVGRCIATIEACGALDSCATQARDLVEAAWKALDPHVVSSLPKVMLRAFGWYVLERQY